MLTAKEALEAAHVQIVNDRRRGSVHSAYFAMFHAATAMGLANGKKYPACSGWLKAFEQAFVANGAIGRGFRDGLIRAYELRQIADYDPAMQISAESAKTTLASAAEFVMMAEKFLEGTGGHFE